MAVGKKPVKSNLRGGKRKCQHAGWYTRPPDNNKKEERDESVTKRRKATKKQVSYVIPRQNIRHRKAIKMNVSRNSAISGGGKHRKDMKAKDEIEDNEDGFSLFDDNMVDTTINHKTFDLSERMEELGVSAQEIAESKVGFTTVSGRQGLQAALKKVLISAGKVMVYGSYSTTELQNNNVLKVGLAPEGWLLLTTALAREEDFEAKNIKRILTDEQIHDLMCFINKVAHTSPEVCCSNVVKSKCPRTIVSSVWWGAKAALGSWYVKDLEKKKKTAAVQSSLARAANGVVEIKVYELSEAERTAKRSGRKKGKKKEQQDEETVEEEIPMGSDEESDDEDRAKQTARNTEANATQHPLFQKRRTKEQEGKSRERPTKKHRSDSDTDDTGSEGSAEAMEIESEDLQADKNNSTKSDKMLNSVGGVKPRSILKKTEQNPQIQTVQTKLNLKVTSNETADTAATRRKHQVRLNIMLKIGNHNTKTANALCLEGIKKLLKGFKEEDNRMALMPWKKADSQKLPVVRMSAFPEALTDLRKYVDRCRPKKNSNVWFGIRITTDLEPQDCTSLDESRTATWYDEYEAKGYLATVQGSDSTVTIGTFLYAGAFIDHHRLSNEIIVELKGKKNKDWMVGCRTKKTKEVERKEGTPWVMASNQMMHIEVDKAQSKDVHYFLYNRMNNKNSKMQRTGGYRFRYLPSKQMITSGTSGTAQRASMLQKHKAVIESLEVTSTTNIKQLDTVYNETTLRHILMNMTYPIVPKPGEKVSSLIHSVDWAASGADAGTAVYVTAYEDRFDLVCSFMEVLPAYIEWAFDTDAKKLWCNHQTFEMEVEFHCDLEANWDGTWTTPDDRMQQDLMDEDMGYAIQLTNMSLLEGNKRRILTEEDASFHTFHAQGKGQQMQLSKNYTDDDSTIAGDVDNNSVNTEVDDASLAASEAESTIVEDGILSVSAGSLASGASGLCG